MTEIIGQAIGVIALLLSCYRYFKKKKTDVMKISIIAYIFYIIHYFLIGALAGSYTLVIAIIRDYYIYLREKHHKKHRSRKLYNNPLVFIALFMTYSILIFFNLSTVENILPLAAGLTYLCFEWFTTNKTTLKFAGGLTTIPWIVYNVICFSVPGTITDSIQLVASFISVAKDKKAKKRR